MLTLGIETSCDETAIAIVKDGREILSNAIASQQDLLEKYGGVYPEFASRRHLEVCQPLLAQSLKEAGVCLEEIDLVAVTIGPGLIGALLVGINFAKGLALGLKKPFIAVNHLEAHLYAPMMEHHVAMPALGLVISGGHTSLVWMEEMGSYQLIGQTVDDAIGEAFDKVARLLDLPFPGGPAIEALAVKGDPGRYPFKAGTVKGRPFDFSFSGLKTAVRYQIEKGEMNDTVKCDIAASFQKAAFDAITKRLLKASQKFSPSSIVLGGGVSNSSTLRDHLATQFDLPLYWPSVGLSLDNGAMIAGLGTQLYQTKGADHLHQQAQSRIPFSPLSDTCQLQLS